MRGLMLPNNDAWRRWRKVFKCYRILKAEYWTDGMHKVLHTGFHSRRAETYKEIQSLESKQALYQILEDPKDYERHLQRYVEDI